MLPRAARPPCLRVPGRFAHRGPAVPRSTPRITTRHSIQFRVFSTGKGLLNKNATSEPSSPPKTLSSPSPLAPQSPDQKTKNAQNAAGKPKRDLLSETTVGKKEQRKADWAIMKEMAKYLWPKVRPAAAIVGWRTFGVNCDTI